MTLVQHRNDLMVLIPIEDQAAYNIKSTWLNTVVNQAYLDFVEQTHILVETWTDTDIPANTINKALPADFISEMAIGFRFDSQTEYHQIYETVGTGHYDSGTTGTPVEYIFKPPATIQLVPIPSAAGDLRMIYHQSPATLTADADESTVPKQYHITVQQFCLARVYERLGNFKAADRYEGKYQAGIFRARAALANRGRLWKQIDETWVSVSKRPRLRVS